MDHSSSSSSTFSPLMDHTKSIQPRCDSACQTQSDSDTCSTKDTNDHGIIPTTSLTNHAIAQYMNKYPWMGQHGVSSHHHHLDHDPHAYLIIHNKVYNIHSLIPVHPGGSVILSYLGQDASDAFDAFHPPHTAETLADYYVGDLVPSRKLLSSPNVSDMNDDQPHHQVFAQRIRSLKQEFEQQGLFQSNGFYFLLHFMINITLLIISLLLLIHYPNSTIMLTLSASIMGLFWQQCGWLAHDFLHHAVFTCRDYNNLVGYLVGGVFQGFSVSWWKNKHNTHHAQPNVHGQDPDIDTMPLLAWSEHALDLFTDIHVTDIISSPHLAKFFIQRQAIFYFPILAIARISWAIQSLLYPTQWWKKSVDTNIPWIEFISVYIHWVWYLGIIIKYLSIYHSIYYIITSQAVCGLLLALVFSLNHNGMEVLSKSQADMTDFYSKQIRTGRDVHPSLFMNWFCGGLNFQIEHHLFPQMPRHHYPIIKPIIVTLCNEFNLYHHSTGFWQGVKEVLLRLHHVSVIANQTLNGSHNNKLD